MKKILFILAGNTLYALAVALFVLPGHLITGGTTGLALVANYHAGIPIAGFVAVFNLLMFLLGLFILGKAFAVTTLISSFYYPLVLGQLQRMIGDFVITEDKMLATIFAGLLIGGGIGLVIRSGASTGGMDIPPLVLNKKFRLPVSVGMYAFDCLILLFQMLFADKEQILYGLLLVLIYTVVLDKVLLIGGNQMQVKIISKQFEEISRQIQQKMDRGTTLFEIEGGYSRNESYAVLAVVSGRELSKLNELVMKIDDQAFMIINQVSEVKGRGFTIQKKYK
ncbi:YitT family protein [Clostridium sp. chh4-2]|uniref:YitT family protein n=1 Tax=Clostridium sp. chh4-2 TaxID=2067550 RepID=UPI000CCDCFE0|nr:YitT family protein [Clostridium sp. chh4-2]PNV59402.1 YitT family protein [Clostridium sp. chh4-2]